MNLLKKKRLWIGLTLLGLMALMASITSVIKNELRPTDESMRGAGLSPEDLARAQKYFAEANQFIVQKRHVDAIFKLEKVIRIDPNFKNAKIIQNAVYRDYKNLVKQSKVKKGSAIGGATSVRAPASK